MTNQSKNNDPRFWNKWRASGACGSGYAYAFFDCNAPKQEIEAEIPHIRGAIQTPNHLELNLIEGISPEMFNDKREYELKETAQDAKEAGLKYTMKARCSTLSNRGVADELSAVLNQAYQSPLYQDKEQFRGGIFYKENGHYVDRE